MNFIQPDEFIICCDDSLLTTDELCRVREAGARTVFERLYWQNIEREPGVFDWSVPDALMANCAAADLKVLLRVGDDAPVHFPDDWYLRSANGDIWRHHLGYGGPTDFYTLLSPWCRAAQAAEREFMLAAIARYAGPTVQLYAGGPHGGEVILPGMIPCYCDEHALASFRAYVKEHWSGDLVEFNRAGGDWAKALPADLPTYADMGKAPATVNWLATSLYNWERERHSMFPEVWLSLVERRTQVGEAYESGPRSGNWLARHLYATLPAELGAELNVLYWEVYRQYGTEGAMDNVAGLFDRTWIGSQFCDGLYVHTDDAIDSGVRGFITGPVHAYNTYDTHRLKDWQLDAIRWSLKRWRAARLEGGDSK